MAVASWAEFPPSPEAMAGGEAWKEGGCDFAGRFSGTCVRCQADMDSQLGAMERASRRAAEHGGEGGDAAGGGGAGAEPAPASVIVALRSEENHMDPCFRFPWDDLQELFDAATVTEAMLLALEHMQVNYVTVAQSGLRKFRRN
eukprot:8311958-Pyramimonas_sp.AAC.1